MVNMTVAEFISAIGSKVKYITYDTTQTEGVNLSDDGLTANVYNVAISGEFSNSTRFPTTIITADLRGLDTSGITSFFRTFYDCEKLTTLNASNWNTSNATDFAQMFSMCIKLNTIDISNFDTSKATQFYCMFDYCSSLTNLDLSNFDTSNATRLDCMFEDCAGLTSLDLSNFDTSNATNISFMFKGCSSLTDLDLSSFDTSKVSDSSFMFVSVNGAKILISDKWTLDTTSTAYKGTNLKFVNAKMLKKIVGYVYLYDTLKNFYTKAKIANILTNTADIATNKTNIATNTENIETNKTNIATNTENISALQTALSGKITGVSITQTDYDALEAKDDSTLYLITE